MNLLAKLFGFLQGRTTAFIIAFFCTGNILQWTHRLDATYISFMGVLMGIVLGHSVKDDYFSNTPTPPDATHGQ